MGVGTVCFILAISSVLRSDGDLHTRGVSVAGACCAGCFALGSACCASLRGVEGSVPCRQPGAYMVC